MKRTKARNIVVFLFAICKYLIKFDNKNWHRNGTVDTKVAQKWHSKINKKAPPKRGFYYLYGFVFQDEFVCSHKIAFSAREIFILSRIAFVSS